MGARGERDQGLREGLSTAEQDRVKELERETVSCGGPTRSSSWRSAFFAQAELDRRLEVMSDVHRRTSGPVRGRADLQGVADRPVGYWAQKQRGGANPQRLPPRQRRDGCWSRRSSASGGANCRSTVPTRSGGSWDAKGGPWPLHGRAPDACSRTAGRRARQGRAHDHPRRQGAVPTGSRQPRSSRPSGRTSCGSPISRTCRPGRVRLRRLRHRRVRPPHRRLAGGALDAHRLRPGRVGAGVVCTAAEEHVDSFGSGYAIRVRFLEAVLQVTSD